jgi:hypothetical protein
MMQDVQVKLNPGLPRPPKFNKKKKFSFYQQIGLKFKEETCEVLLVEHSLV